MDKAILKKAISDTPEPTPGYLYRDIMKMTYEDTKTQDKLVAYLLDKLKESSTHVLSKTLRVIKHVCQEGHPDCQKQFQKQSDTIKACASFRGRPDPTFGDMLNQQVRDAAREAMEAAFNPRKDAKSNLVVESQGGEVLPDEGGPRERFKTGYSVGSDGTRKDSSSLGSQVKDVVKTGLGFLKEKPKSANDKMLEDLQNQSHGQYVMPPMPVPGVGADPNTNATVPIPGFGKSEDSSSWTSLSGGGGTAAPVKVLTPVQSLVEKYATMRTTPQRLELSTFLQAATSLANEGGSDVWSDVAEALDGYLVVSGPWQHRLNALCCVEVLAKGNVAEVLEYFAENPEEMQKNVNVVQTTLKDRALKVLTMMGLPTRAPEAKAPTQAAVFAHPDNKQGMSWSPSLSNDGLSQNGSDNGGMFGVGIGDGMKVRDRSQRDKTKLKKRGTSIAGAGTTATPTDGTLSAPPRPAPTTTTDDIFAGMAMSTPSAPPPAPAPAALKKPATDFLDDLFAAPATSQQQQQQQQRFFLCPSHFDHGCQACEAGSQCVLVHIDAQNVVDSNVVHINDFHAQHQRLTHLNPGSKVRVHDATTGASEGREFPSEHILWTKGSRDLATGRSGARRVFHCHHFLTKGWCVRGDLCSFMHVIGAAPRQQTNNNNNNSNINNAVAPALLSMPNINQLQSSGVYSPTAMAGTRGTTNTVPPSPQQVKLPASDHGLLSFVSVNNNNSNGYQQQQQHHQQYPLTRSITNSNNNSAFGSSSLGGSGDASFMECSNSSPLVRYTTSRLYQPQPQQQQSNYNYLSSSSSIFSGGGHSATTAHGSNSHSHNNQQCLAAASGAPDGVYSGNNNNNNSFNYGNYF
eukprot:PhM_4_TR11664/c1_g1_i3/m.64162